LELPRVEAVSERATGGMLAIATVTQPETAKFAIAGLMFAPPGASVPERSCGCAGKKIVGRKRHIAVDNDGQLLMVNLTTADISSGAGAQALLDAVRKRWPSVKNLFADAAYDRLKLMDKAAYLDFVVEIIRRSDDQKGIQVLSCRWVVERTSAG